MAPSVMNITCVSRVLFLGSRVHNSHKRGPQITHFSQRVRTDEAFSTEQEIIQELLENNDGEVETSIVHVHHCCHGWTC